MDEEQWREALWIPTFCLAVIGGGFIGVLFIYHVIGYLITGNWYLW